MILKNLTLCDFGLFKGKHSFDLSPRVRYGHKCPIILFGGLNGSGKTTLLTAIRLGLYGKQSLGLTTNKNTYHHYLKETIHKSRHDLIRPHAASIDLTLTYARQGELNEYHIRRAWENEGGRINESLVISCDGKVFKELSSELCQAFLNELVPIGVSELFFFDGEKIAELAEDDTGEILHHAVRKLLGLDIIGRLRNDLASYLQRQKQTILPEEFQKEIQLMEESYQQTLNRKDQELAAAHKLFQQIKRLQKEVHRLESVLSESGGAYAQTREIEQDKQERLLNEKIELETQLRELLSGIFPLSLAQKQLNQLLSHLEQEAHAKKKQAIADILQKRLTHLNTQIHHALPKKYVNKTIELIEATFEDFLTSEPQGIRHDVSDSSLAKVRSWISQTIPQSTRTFQTLKKRLFKLEEEFKQSHTRLERTPDTATLQSDLQTLSKKNKQLGELQHQHDQHLEQAGLLLREAMETTQTMQKLHDQQNKHWRDNQAIFYATSTRQLLEEFSACTTQRRLLALEQEFIRAFQRLSRKEDMHIQAKIDPETFNVTLFDEHHHHLAKNQLSAGEKQIYAIAILEALARTSGRKLPVIIDTPLGRLDSQHRAKLVKHYFSQVSHQVIILSTDTEIDKLFYSLLGPEISHAFHLEYDQVQGCSFAHPGYFWRTETVHAS